MTILQSIKTFLFGSEVKVGQVWTHYYRPDSPFDSEKFARFQVQEIKRGYVKGKETFHIDGALNETTEGRIMSISYLKTEFYLEP